MAFWVLFGLVTLYVLYGALVRSPYARRFPDNLTPGAALDGYLVPVEIEDPDEAAMTGRVATAFKGDTTRLKKGAGAEDPAFHEPHWGHTTGLLQGSLTLDNIDALPERFRVGLFANSATYPVVARPNFAVDPDLKLKINRLAVKLKMPVAVPNMYADGGTAHELDLLFAEGVLSANGAGRQFFVRDGRQLDMARTLNPPSVKTLNTLKNWRNVGIFLGVLNDVKASMAPLHDAPANVTGWAGKPYFSAGPYALGDGAMKFSLMPKQDHKIPAVDLKKGDPVAAHKAAMEEWLDRKQDAEFDLCVQIATPDAIPEPGPEDPPKDVMAAEYCDLVWDEAKAPYIRVGTLTLRADRTLSTDYAWSPVQFNAWNTFEENRPLGQLFRMRKHVHKAHANTRVSHLYNQQPGAMVDKCPFGGGA